MSPRVLVEEGQPMGESFAGAPVLTTTVVAVRLSLAFVLGALAGVERQWHHKNAGLRTHTLVAAGAVTGIGFIGGGVIMHQGPTVQGINTAATLWTTASMGLAAGAGYYALTAMTFTALLLV